MRVFLATLALPPRPSVVAAAAAVTLVLQLKGCLTEVSFWLDIQQTRTVIVKVAVGIRQVQPKALVMDVMGSCVFSVILVWPANSFSTTSARSCGRQRSCVIRAQSACGRRRAGRLFHHHTQDERDELITGRQQPSVTHKYKNNVCSAH